MEQFELVVTAGEVVDRTLATASWWDRHRLVPGRYPVVFTTIAGTTVEHGERPAVRPYDPDPAVDAADPEAHWKYARHLDETDRGWHWDDLEALHPKLRVQAQARRIEERYYATVRVPTILEESHRENRLLSAVSAQREQPETPSSYRVCMYGYECKAGARILDGHGTVVAVTAAVAGAR